MFPPRLASSGAFSGSQVSTALQDTSHEPSNYQGKKLLPRTVQAPKPRIVIANLHKHPQTLRSVRLAKPENFCTELAKVLGLKHGLRASQTARHEKTKLANRQSPKPWVHAGGGGRYLGPAHQHADVSPSLSLSLSLPLSLSLTLKLSNSQTLKLSNSLTLSLSHSLTLSLSHSLTLSLSHSLTLSLSHSLTLSLSHSLTLSLSLAPSLCLSHLLGWAPVRRTSDLIAAEADEDKGWMWG